MGTIGSHTRSRALPLATVSAVVFSIVFGSATVHAYETDGLFFYIDANDPGSYSTEAPDEWNDISPAQRNGTIVGTVTKTGDALSFPGTVNDYVDMGDAGFDNFGTGITIEFEGHFGAVNSGWERIFDWGNGAATNNLWVGVYGGVGGSADPNEITVEVWKKVAGTATNMGRCRTNGDALVINKFDKFVLTLDGTTCRIYKNGTELNTVVDGPAKNTASGGTAGSSYDTFYDTPTSLGSAYPALPDVEPRTNNFIGKSNWASDPAFNGSIKYVRVYTKALTPEQVTTNATTYTLTYSSSGSTEGTAPASRTGNGLITLDTNSGELEKSGFTFAGWATSENQTSALSSPYNLTANTTLYPVWVSITQGGSSSGASVVKPTGVQLAATGMSPIDFMLMPGILVLAGVGAWVFALRRTQRATRV